jgi:DNA-binding SARP family transcriptional activator
MNPRNFGETPCTARDRVVEFGENPQGAYSGGQMAEENVKRPAVRTALALLDGFELRVDGRFVTVPAHVQRLLAFLAIRRRPQHRTSLAGALWLDTAEDHASRNLRTALWRAGKVSKGLVETNGAYVAIQPDVRVDLADAIDRAESVLAGPSLAWGSASGSVAELGGDLLPDWSEDWVLIERERMRQLRMHALEALCGQLTAAGRFGHAVEAGLAAVAVEPLRESAHRVLIEAYLAEGNLCEAVRHLDDFAMLLDDSLGVAPSPALVALVAVARS